MRKSNGSAILKNKKISYGTNKNIDFLERFYYNKFDMVNDMVN